MLCRRRLRRARRQGAWIQTYITQDKLFGVAVFESEADIAAYRARVGASGQQITIHRIIDAADAAAARAD